MLPVYRSQEFSSTSRRRQVGERTSAYAVRIHRWGADSGVRLGARQFPRYLNVHLFLKKHAFVRFYPFGSRRRYKRLHRRAIMSRKVKTSDFFGTVPIPKPRPRGLKLESSLTIATRAFVPIPKPRFRGLKLQVLFESCGYALQSQYPNPALGD